MQLIGSNRFKLGRRFIVIETLEPIYVGSSFNRSMAVKVSLPSARGTAVNVTFDRQVIWSKVKFIVNSDTS